MFSSLEENPSREKILLLLKKNGFMSIDNLSRELNITSMGIRQHLLSLERKGLIDYVVRRQGIGRPAFLYRLTQKAEELFPKAYDKFIINLLRDIEKYEGHDKIEEIFKWHKNSFLKGAKEAISDKKTSEDKIHGLKDFLDSEGYFTEIHATNNHYSVKIFNCTIYRLANDYKEVCQYHLQMFKDLLGKEVTREECITEGNASCTYTVPKTSLK